MGEEAPIAVVEFAEVVAAQSPSVIPTALSRLLSLSSARERKLVCASCGDSLFCHGNGGLTVSRGRLVHHNCAGNPFRLKGATVI